MLCNTLNAVQHNASHSTRECHTTQGDALQYSALQAQEYTMDETAMYCIYSACAMI